MEVTIRKVFRNGVWNSTTTLRSPNPQDLADFDKATEKIVAEIVSRSPKPTAESCFGEPVPAKDISPRNFPKRCS